MSKEGEWKDWLGWIIFGEKVDEGFFFIDFIEPRRRVSLEMESLYSKITKKNVYVKERRTRRKKKKKKNYPSPKEKNWGVLIIKGNQDTGWNINDLGGQGLR